MEKLRWREVFRRENLIVCFSYERMLERKFCHEYSATGVDTRRIRLGTVEMTMY